VASATQEIQNQWAVKQLVLNCFQQHNISIYYVTYNLLQRRETASNDIWPIVAAARGTTRLDQFSWSSSINFGRLQFPSP